MALPFAFAVFVVAWCSAVILALSLRPRPLPLALPLAYAVLVAYEGVAFPVLSIFRAVTPLGVIAAQLPLVAGAAVYSVRSRARSAVHVRAVDVARRLAWALRPRWLFLTLLVPAVLVLAAGLLYPPNTWDSMTYHLARVAHWIAERSVDARQTWLARQTLFPPGAEYLLLLLQVVSGSDRLAFTVQFVAWATLIVSAPSVARSFGAPRRLAGAAALLVATLPMGVLQASSTQNDLVASTTAVAIVVAALPLAHARLPRMREGVALGVAVAAAWLVKPTALAVCVPFLCWAVLAGTRGRPGPALRQLGRWALIAAVPATFVVLAETLRRAPFGYPLIAQVYLYPAVGEWVDRIAHSVRAISNHLPISGALSEVAPILAPPSGTGLGDGPQPLRPHEDHAGNPIHVIIFVIASSVAAVRWRKLPRRALVVPAALIIGWVLLHATLRGNSWFSRLETPLFVLAPAALCAFARSGEATRKLFPTAVAAAALPLLAYSAWFAAANELRTPTHAPRDPVAGYYIARPELRRLDDATLAVAKRLKCQQLGVSFYGVTGEPGYPDPWDYPLMWRARSEGIAVRHVAGDDEWPCLIACMYCQPSPPERGRWIRIPETFVYGRLVEDRVDASAADSSSDDAAPAATSEFGD